eukprot:scaffold14_cov380-Prasinococcus_capsulatus_cf.AAC.12
MAMLSLLEWLGAQEGKGSVPAYTNGQNGHASAWLRLAAGRSTYVMSTPWGLATGHGALCKNTSRKTQYKPFISVTMAQSERLRGV